MSAIRRDCSREAEASEILVTAGCAESAFDKHSQTNEDLLSAYLKDRHATWMDWFETTIEAKYEATGGGLEIIADVLQEGFDDPKSLALAFLNVVTQSGDSDKEPLAIVSEQKEHLGRFIEHLAVRMGLQHSDMAASTAVVIIEQTIVRTVTTGSLTEAKTARLLFQCLQRA